MTLCIAKEEPPAAPSLQGAYVSLEQAAYIMQQPVETLMEYINNGLLLTLKPIVEGKTILIHQSELDRFRFPWKHIWRLDKRLDSIQAMCDVLKSKVVSGEDILSRLYRLEYVTNDLDDIAESVKNMENRFSVIESDVMEMIENHIKVIDYLIASFDKKK